MQANNVGRGRSETAVAQHATMRDVALLAGVSLKTVSRVVNGDSTVGAELAARVRGAAAKLDYRPNQLASDLARSRANTSGRASRPSTIGLLIQDVSNEFSAQIFRAVEDVAQARGVTVLASNVNEDAEREKALMANLVTRRVHGVIVVPTSVDHGYLAREQRTGVPVVFVDRPPLFLKADCVLSDNEVGSRGGVRHLISQGHRHIGYLGESSRYLPARARYEGYTEALREARLPADQRVVRRELETEEDARRAAIDVIRQSKRLTALFTGNNRLTIGAVRALRELNLERTIALVGFDDFGLADLLQPGVTVVAQDPVGLGTLGADLLFRRIAGEIFPVEEHVVPTRLLVRGSGEIPPR